MVGLWESKHQNKMRRKFINQSAINDGGRVQSKSD
jgi:hypothetical protein